MTEGWVFFAVALAAFAMQVSALVRLLGAGQLASRGLLRTSACRVGAALAYVCLAIYVLHASDPQTIASVTLGVFSSVQVLWITNGLLDVRLRRRIEGGTAPTRVPTQKGEVVIAARRVVIHVRQGS